MARLTVVTSEEGSGLDSRFEDIDARLPADPGPPTFEEWLTHAENAEARGNLILARTYLSLAQHADRRSRSREEVRLEAIEGGDS